MAAASRWRTSSAAAAPLFRTTRSEHLDRDQRRVMGAIEACRTAALGGHVRRCAYCGHTAIA